MNTANLVLVCWCFGGLPYRYGYSGTAMGLKPAAGLVRQAVGAGDAQQLALQRELGQCMDTFRERVRTSPFEAGVV